MHDDNPPAFETDISKPSPSRLFVSSELLAPDPIEAPHQVSGMSFHGGFDMDGRYVPPRSQGRRRAIVAWRDRLAARGWPLLECERAAHPFSLCPNLEQHQLLLDHGLKRLFWDALTTTSINEGKGGTLCFIPPVDFQSEIEEAIAETATGHLWEGLFWAHGVDEAGDRATLEGGHKHMWLLIRDTLLPQEDFVRPRVETLHSRPRPEREMPCISAELERIIEICLSLLQVEIRSFVFADLCLALIERRHNFHQCEEAEEMARLIRRICQDEEVHIAYLQVFLSELRSFHFKDQRGNLHRGADLIDPVWEAIRRWPDAQEYARREASARQAVLGEAAQKLSPSELEAFMQAYDAAA